MSTTALNLSTTTNPTSNTPPSLPTGASLLSNLKLPNTVIIQPPSSIITRPSTLLNKRYNPAELGDLLLKKIKSQNSNNNSNQHSPTHNPNHENNHLNCLENNSMIEEVSSPSIRSFCEESEVPNPQKMLLEGVLMPQRSNTAPLAFNTFNLRHPKSGASDPHRQVQHALEVLQKKLLMDQQAAALKDLLLKVQLAQEPLIIPPLLSQSSFKSGKSNENSSANPIKPLKNLDNEQEVYYGEVEYPLLAMAPPSLDGSLLQKDTNLPGSNGRGNEIRMPARNKNGSFESLSATRADTQRSESDGNSSYMSEESPKRASTKKNINKRKPDVNKRGQKLNRDQGKDNNKSKAEVRRQRNDELLSPLVKGRKMTERKKNKWQTGEVANVNQNAGNTNNTTESHNNS